MAQRCDVCGKGPAVRQPDQPRPQRDTPPLQPEPAAGPHGDGGRPAPAARVHALPALGQGREADAGRPASPPRPDPRERRATEARRRAPLERRDEVDLDLGALGQARGLRPWSGRAAPSRGSARRPRSSSGSRPCLARNTVVFTTFSGPIFASLSTASRFFMHLLGLHGDVAVDELAGRGVEGDLAGARRGGRPRSRPASRARWAWARRAW